MMKQTVTSPPMVDLSADFGRALLSTARKSTGFEPPAELTALLKLLVKPRRIAATLGVEAWQVRNWAMGRMRVAEGHKPGLSHLLRLAVGAAQKEIGRAERREILWGSTAFPEETLNFFRGRIAEAEAILGKEQGQ